MTPEKPVRTVLWENLYCNLDIAGVASLVVVGLVAIGLHMVDVDLEVEPMTGQEVAGVVLCIVKIGIERTVGELTTTLWTGDNIFGEQMDGAAKRAWARRWRRCQDCGRGSIAPKN